MLCVENLYLEVNMCNAVIRPSEGGVAETKTPFTLLQDTEPSEWFEAAIKVKKKKKSYITLLWSGKVTKKKYT